MNAILKPGTLLHKRYEVVKQLGQGDFGTVYQACDQHAVKSNRFVAIKQMPMQMIVDCERQADLRADLIHPNIPRIFGYFVTNEHSYLVEELIRGSNLEKLLEEQRGFLPQKRVIHWAIQICAALDFLHNHPRHPMVFRDLKPNNIMANRADKIHLIDFGLARTFPPGFFRTGQTQLKHYRKGAAMGTKGYSPPEQYRGMVKPQSDIYALGATLHHLLTRRDPRKERPFSFQEMSMRSLTPNISRDLEVIVMKALERNIKRRFSTAKELQWELERISS